MICFLDRDGILNVDYGYVGTKERYRWNEEIFDILLYLKELGYRFVVVTNQSGIGRGYYSLADFYDLSFYIINYLVDNYEIDIEINFCPHKPEDACDCRKPSPQMMQRYKITNNDIMIGDNTTDMIAANSAGIGSRWLVSKEPMGPYTHSFKDMTELKMCVVSGTLITSTIKGRQEYL